MSCIFCTLPHERLGGENEHGVWTWDRYPVAHGHCLVIPRRHIASFFDSTQVERLALLALIDEAKAAITKKLTPDGFNIGINDGAAAGQTVPHLHIHLIPRYAGDVQDPRGGIRWVLPERADYWTGA